MTSQQRALLLDLLGVMSAVSTAPGLVESSTYDRILGHVLAVADRHGIRSEFTAARLRDPS